MGESLHAHEEPAPAIRALSASNDKSGKNNFRRDAEKQERAGLRRAHCRKLGTIASLIRLSRNTQTKIMTMKLTTTIVAALVVAVTSAPAGATYRHHHHHRMYHSSAATNNPNGTGGGPTTLSGTGSSKFGGSTPGTTGHN